MHPELPTFVDTRAVQGPRLNLLKLPADTTMEGLNTLLASINQNEWQRDSELLIDMEDVEFILVECLTALIAEVSGRQRRGVATKFLLPLSRDVRGFLRDWEFPKAFRLATGASLMDLVPRENVSRIREIDGSSGSSDPRRYGHDRVYQDRDRTLRVPIDSHRFFSFRHWDAMQFRLPDDPMRFKRAVLDESERWIEDPTLRQVLVSQLGEYYSYLPSTVVHEAMSNAFRHGNATSVIAVSKGELSVRPGRSRFLTLVFWDNGLPSYSTLRQRLDSGFPIVGVTAASAPTVTYEVRPPTASKSVGATTYSSREPPTAEAADWELFLASTFPGVTADPLGAQHVHHPSIAGELDAAKPGRGLSNLLNGAVDVFRGSVAFRSGEYFMNFKRPKEKRGQLAGASPTYSVKIRRTWPFLGNMLTIRLPLHD